MSEEIYKAYRAWQYTLERGQTIDVEQAFAAGYRAAACDIARDAGILKKLIAEGSPEEPRP